MAVTRAESFSELLSQDPASGRELASSRLHAGTQSAVPLGADSFFGLRFGIGEHQGADPAVVHVPLGALGSGTPREVRVGPAAVERDATEGIGTVATAEHVVVHARVPGGGDVDIAAVTQAVYLRLLTRVRELGYPYLVRIWNFVPDINGGTGDAETYVHFNHGRVAAFDQLGMSNLQYPAATAVGSPAGSPLTVVMLASRSEPVAIENPRQTSSYLYPRRYGPRTPAFARAMLLPDRAGGKLYISGTASIVGHESRHQGIEPQLAETLANIDQVMETALAGMPGYATGSRGSWRVYLRNPVDLECVEAEVSRRLGGRDSVIFLQADICRRELLVEIEGVCELTPVSPAPPG